MRVLDARSVALGLAAVLAVSGCSHGGSSDVDPGTDSGTTIDLDTWTATGGVLTYQRLSGDTSTVSGTTAGGDVFFQRTVWGPGSNSTLTWSSPAAAQGRLGALVEHSADTFRAGQVAELH
jgi:hypothetical protein